ncbi:MAG: SH3 domain-containing protein [Lewinella sp.]|nr:SH3 domain-containing protein [Lewinella sp.]
MAAEKGKPTTVIKMEFVVFAVLMFILLIWAVRKCNRTQNELEEQATALEQQDSLAQQQAATTAAQQTPITPPRPAGVTADTIGGGDLRIIREKITPLYVTIDGLNMRSGPGLNHEVVDRFDLYTEVVFLNEVTDSLYEIKLGTITTREPWVKIRSPKGRVGWVYGAGVDYYKYELKGVE